MGQNGGNHQGVGILRLIVNHPSRAENALREQGFTVSQTEVIAVGVEDVPGGLSTALTVLKDAQIAVEYMYAFVSKEEKTAYVILRVEDNAHAENVLRTHDIKILSGDEIY